MIHDDENKSQHLPWNEGLPTKPDVDALLRAFPPETLKPGEWHATDDEIKAHIGRPDGNRYRTIYSAWIRRLGRDHAVIVYREKESGFYCPTPEQVFANTHPALESAGRRIGKQLRGVAIVKPENELQRGVQEHQGRLLHASKRDLKKARMNVLPSTVAPEQPRIEPPKNAGASSKP